MFFIIHNYNIRSMQAPRCASQCVCVSGNYAYRITGISIDTGIITSSLMCSTCSSAYVLATITVEYVSHLISFCATNAHDVGVFMLRYEHYIAKCHQ